MSINIIPCYHNRIDKIYHVADIHFRNVKRHVEYNEVLNRFYAEVENRGTENSIIIIAGDLAHSKLDTSPELSDELAKMMEKCSKLTDTVIIPGNHDANLNNKQRLDVISPIVDYMKNDRIHYLKENGLYMMKNLLFSHYGIFSNVDDFITYKNIPSKYKYKTDTHIALYHGPLHKSVTDSNYEVSNISVKPELFDGFHFGILGDIHKQQTIFIKKSKPAYIPSEWIQDPDDINSIMKEYPIIRYPGSLIQQNHAEKIEGHGFTLWDISKKSYEHVEIPNDYGFFTAEIRDGKLTTDITDIPSKARLRFRCFHTEPIEVKRILEEIKKVHDIQEVSYVRGDDSRKLNRGNIAKISLQKLNDYHFQNTLISEHIENHFPRTPKKVLKRVLDLNEELNSNLTDKDRPFNIIWEPKIFKFDNMFSYGEGNIIDFSKIKGISGIFGPNTIGKSSIFSALSFCLFDKCDRTFKASHIMNESKMSFKCELNFTIDGINYFVKRQAKRDKNGNVRVEVDFWKMVDGEQIILNDESRRSTNEVIRSYIGSYDDFVLTSLSPQKDSNNNFADKGQTERKDLIVKFLGIDIFDSLYQLALEKSKDLSAEWKSYDDEQIKKDIETLKLELDDLNVKHSEMRDFRTHLTEEHSEILRQIIDKGSQIKKIDGVTENISSLTAKLDSLSSLLEEIDVDPIEKHIEVLKNDISEVETEVGELISQNVEENYRKFVSCQQEMIEIQSQIEVLKLTVQNKLEKVQFLENHEYDPGCEFCMRNQFVQDALKAKEELNDLKPVVDEIISKKENLTEMIKQLSPFEESYQLYKTLQNQLISKASEVQTLQNKIYSETAKRDKISQEIKEVEIKIDKYHQSIDIAKNNESLQQEIRQLNTEENEMSRKLKIATEKISDVFSDIKYKNSQLENLQKKITELKDLELEMRSYKLYINCIHRDGVPYDIISKSVPTIEKEVNEILGQIVEFGVMLNLDGKNINASLVYDDRIWPVEMGSGMESFISNLAIRIALSNISNMPKTNFLAIDEGFGSLDEESFAAMPSLFSFLRNSFEFILVISHIDYVKDFADTHIEIRKDKNFSKVVFK